MKHGKPQTVRQAADQFGVSRYAIYAWIKQGRLGYVRLGRAIRIPSNEIARVLTQDFRPPATP